MCEKQIQQDTEANNTGLRFKEKIPEKKEDVKTSNYDQASYEREIIINLWML